MKTVESVTEGHPDKVCDQIADAILDEYLAKDPASRVACEVFGSHGALMIGGEVTSTAEIDVARIAQQVYKDIGYDEQIDVFTNMEKQSTDIARGVDAGGAGDQGIMYGYATMETQEYLPECVVSSHKLAWGLADLRRNHPDFQWLRPDGKTQVTQSKDKVHAVVVSTQHRDDVSQEEIRKLLLKHLIEPVIGNLEGVDVIINPSGPFVSGGFAADTGLTGRKIMVDTYGGIMPHGGGAFSGKDPSKVDRSAAYMARYVAINVVKSGLAKECEVQLAYAIGIADPVSIMVDTFGSSKISEDKISNAIREVFELKPSGIIKSLDLLNPIYTETAAYGHFGRTDNGFSWEKTDKTDELLGSIS
ncbi:MAG: methionine adenosyltransferase [Candidatus Dadabacteria bacterium]|nr:methionine adenosyltransferase [Candidatus Dadabacteria bacterium]